MVDEATIAGDPELSLILRGALDALRTAVEE
jgi:predicted lipid carrier protein YhbT